MAWTKAQEVAIYERGKNIIVSAGAGSGKTAVLSERILDYCLKGNDIRDVLVLTFTNAAAKEMKERIRKKLIQNNLNDQAIYIDSADITTFDAYSLGLVKKYYYLLNLDKDLSIIDKSLLTIKRKKILDEMFSELYQIKDEQFFSLLTRYTTKKDDDLKEIISKLAYKIELIVDENFVENYEQNYYSNEFITGVVKQFENLVMNEVNELLKETKYLLDLANMEATQTFINHIENCVNVLESVDSYDDLILKFGKLNYGRKSNTMSSILLEQKDLCKELYDNIKNKRINKYLFLDDAKKELFNIKNDILLMLNMANTLNKKVLEYKYEIMCFDYIDIAKIAIKLLKENKIVKDEIKYKLKEILIDEYQDTSDIQDIFISLIENNNCYMVGDIKQSIYRFRNANPNIFKEKYDNYSKGINGFKIDLTHNFRSRKEVLNNINLIFNSLMTNEFGDANYVIDHQMNYGQKDYEKLEQDYDFNMEILGYDSLDNLTDAEHEAFIAGNEIKKIMDANNKRLFNGEYVDVKYSDFAILIDRSKNFGIFKKVFEYLGIPLSIEGNMDLNDSIFLKLFSNILYLIANNLLKSNKTKYNHCLVSVGRSFLFNYSDDQLFDMIKEGVNNELIDIIDDLSNSYKFMNLVEIYYEIIDRFKIYEKLPLIGDVDASNTILEFIYNIFKSMESISMSLQDASVYLGEIFEEKIKLDYKAKTTSSDSVHIMTIHNSKGLEYPYCIFPMLSENFNQSDKRDSCGFSNKYGVYIPYSEETKSNTIVKTLIEEDFIKSDISEKIRLFYVALTRAREKIIIISNNEEYKQKKLKPKGFTCFNHMVRAFDFMNQFINNVDSSNIGISYEYKKSKINKILESKPSIKYDSNKYISDELVGKRISKEMKELKDDSLNEIINLGNELHAILEALDFNDVNIDDLDIDNNKKNIIKRLLKHDIFKEIKKAKTYHELEFYYNEYHGIIDLLCVYEDHVDIIDYKLSDINKEEYVRQLNIYKEYVSSIINKPIKCYLLSILRKEIKEV